MELNHSTEPSSHSDSQEILCLFFFYIKPECSLPCSQEPVNGQNPEPQVYSSHSLTLFPEDPF